MIQKLMTLALGLSLVALAACSGGGKKLTLNKTLKPGKTATGNAATANTDLNKLLDANKVCLPLSQMMANLEANKGMFVIYIQSRKLIPAGTLTDDPKLNFAYVIQPLKALSEAVYGTNLRKSVLVGSLLDVTSDSNCDNVKFNTNDDSFTIQKSVNPPTIGKNANNQPIVTQGSQGAPRRLTLSGKTTSREYLVNGNNLTIDVTEPISGAAVEPCKGTMTTAPAVKTRYVITLNPPTAATGISLDPAFANLLLATLNDPGTLTSSVSSTQQTIAPNLANKAGVKTRPVDPNASTISGVPVPYQELETYSKEIQDGQIKAAQCK